MFGHVETNELNIPTKDLGSVVEIRNGRDYKHIQNDNGSYPVYGSGGIMTYADEFICPEDTVIIGRKGTIDNPILVHEKFWNVDTAFGMICNQSILNPLFFYWFCKNYNFKQHNKATTLPSLTKQDLQKIRIIVPSKKEQGEFADFVRQVDKSKMLMKKCFENYDQLVKSRFIEMFGDPLANPMMWNTEPLCNITTVIRNGFTPPNAKSTYIDDGIVFLQSQNVWNNRIEYGNTQFIPEDLNKKMKSTELMVGDVLITKTGRINTENSSLGRISLFRGYEKSVNISSEIYLIRVTDIINPEFLMHLLLTDSYRRFIRNCSPGGTDKRHLYSRYVEQFKIIIPPIDLQNQFTYFVQQVDKSKFISQHCDRNRPVTQILYEC